jgi:aspartate aminotransferase-like enzyme
VSYKLFIPGPIAVSDKTYRALCQPMIGHRSNDFVKLYESMQPDLQLLFGTKDPVYLSTSSAWGIMEGAVNNVCHRKVLNCMCGAFSDKWQDVSMRNGIESGALQVPWGKPITAEALDEALSTGEYDCVTLIHNETSTGVMSPLPAIAEVLRKYPEVISIIDTVSSFSVVPIPKDELGIDILITGSQKALALPPGLALASVSQRALERASRNPKRGYYFDLLEFQANHEKGMTPSTPNIPLFYALRSKLDDILEEGIPQRHERHQRLNRMVHEWVLANGFEFFAPEGYRSVSLTCVANNRNIDVASWIKILKQDHSMVIDGGYGKIKGKTFRISNMGDETEATIQELLLNLSASLARVATS